MLPPPSILTFVHPNWLLFSCSSSMQGAREAPNSVLNFCGLFAAAFLADIEV